MGLTKLLPDVCPQRAAETARGLERDFCGDGEVCSEGRGYFGGARDSRVSPTGAEMSFL
jgi:hypothetical protein